MTQFQADVLFALSFPVTIFYFAYNLALATTYYDKLKSQSFPKSYCLKQVIPVVFLGVCLELIYVIGRIFKSKMK